MKRDDALFIRECAAKGLSKSHTAQLLRFSRWPPFINHLASLGLTDLEWCKGANSVLAKLAREALHESNRGKTISEGHKAILRKFTAARNAQLPRYTAFGITDSLESLIKRFARVSGGAVRLRIKNGMAVEAALTTPRLKQKPCREHPWNQASRAGAKAHAERLQRRAA